MHTKPPRRRALLKAALLFFLFVPALCWTLVRAPQVPRAVAQTPIDYKNFEAPQVHPIALTPDGTRLLALDTPEQRIEVFRLDGAQLTLVREIPVGAEPTSIAVRNNAEAWVAN